MLKVQDLGINVIPANVPLGDPNGTAYPRYLWTGGEGCTGRDADKGGGGSKGGKKGSSKGSKKAPSKKSSKSSSTAGGFTDDAVAQLRQQLQQLLNQR